jgi:hypothetical protein
MDMVGKGLQVLLVRAWRGFSLDEAVSAVGVLVGAVVR